MPVEQVTAPVRSSMMKLWRVNPPRAAGRRGLGLITGVPIGGAGGSGAVGRIVVHPQTRALLAGRGGHIRGIGSPGGDLTAVTRSPLGGGPRLGDDRLIAARLIGLRLVGGDGVTARVRGAVSVSGR